MTDDELRFLVDTDALASALVKALGDQNPAIASLGLAEAAGRLAAYMASALFDKDDVRQRKKLANTLVDRALHAYFETLEKIDQQDTPN